MKVVLFDADAEGDGALENSHWVAEQTAVALAPQAVETGDPRRGTTPTPRPCRAARASVSSRW